MHAAHAGNRVETKIVVFVFLRNHLINYFLQNPQEKTQFHFSRKSNLINFDEIQYVCSPPTLAGWGSIGLACDNCGPTIQYTGFKLGEGGRGGLTQFNKGTACVCLLAGGEKGGEGGKRGGEGGKGGRGDKDEIPTAKKIKSKNTRRKMSEWQNS